ncbi:MAG: hypothetical protein A2X23_02550 [Chloroflexi bacterium GWC2_73_18]|nr:MAG: hypothetical protein A2X23_02550 [Chloroflexi bacterium GWC2_73_18]
MSRRPAGVGAGRGAGRGQVLVLFVIALTVLLAAAALAVDFAVWLTERRAMQNAADAAAQAGIAELLRRPITEAKRAAAAEHAMDYLDRQLALGLAPGEVTVAAAHALGDADGFGAEDGTSYQGGDRLVIRTPVGSADSCRGGSWGSRALTVRVDHVSERFFSRILSSSDPHVGACATSAVFGGGLAVAVLKPNQTAPGVYATQPNNATITMKLAGQDSYVRIWGGDVGINSTFSAAGAPPPSSPNEPAFVKFMTSAENHMLATIEAPSPPTWSVEARQVRVEGASELESDDVYHAPVHLPGYIPIPPWGSDSFVQLVATDAGVTPITISKTTTPNGTCTDPVTDEAGIAPGKYDLIEVATGERRWLCPGVFHLVRKGGTQGLQLASNSTIAGQGVTLVFESDSVLRVDSGGALLLNVAAAGGETTAATWQTGSSFHDVPMTIWIEPVAGCDPLAPACSDSTSSDVFTIAGGAGLDLRGIIFGPTDKMKIAGNDLHHGSGEIWAWTIEYAGNSQLDQVYEGADDGYPLLVE